ncbi:hypothetical protein RUMTOR_01551 [[Ruminococcus] torques ATCC 27756]|uniref:Uncharacterized protein n=1 Tax=[Ruminococcus] torques ATCC 27756 TaxID=411460 RepID=A5KMS8_9FIRM|nr:hypothetical protein RUMTOR_01551 [[Ruminococcus] torques ATCC 27756]
MLRYETNKFIKISEEAFKLWHNLISGQDFPERTGKIL